MLILMGPSASGKTEVAKILERTYSLKKVVTHTTRAMRVHEVNDVDYHFVSKDTFLLMKENNEFVETTTYNNNYYGTSKKEINDDKCVILDPQGAEVFYDLNDDHIFIVYLKCDENVRYQRMVFRLDDPDIIKVRMTNDRKTFTSRCEEISNAVIDSNNIDLITLANNVYSLYQEHLNNIK